MRKCFFCLEIVKATEEKVLSNQVCFRINFVYLTVILFSNMMEMICFLNNYDQMRLALGHEIPIDIVF